MEVRNRLGPVVIGDQGFVPLLPLLHCQWAGLSLVEVSGVRGPPTCTPASAICKSAACSCAAAAGFHAAVEGPTAAAPPIPLQQLRVFFLDGHTGPLNDMVSFLTTALGIEPR